MSEGTEMQAAKEQPTTTEPVENATDAALVSVGPTVSAVLGLAMLALFIVATPIEWMSRRQPIVAGGDSYVGIFSWWTRNTGNDQVQYVSQYTCDELRMRSRAVEVFAVISVILSGLLLIAALAARVAGKGKGALLGLSVGVFVSSLVAWAMFLRIFFQSGICAPAWSSDSFSQQKFEIGPGCALFITGWCVSALAVIVAAVDPKVPAVVPDSALDKVVGVLYAAFSFIAFAFVVIGTPLSIVYAWVTPSLYVRATMWNVYIISDGTMVTKVGFDEFSDALHFDCGLLSRYAHFAQAFSIIAIGFMFFAFIAGLLFAAGKIGKKAPMILGTLGTLTALICAAACATMYYRHFCNGSLLAGKSLEGAGFVLAVGVALFVAAVLVLAVATIIVAIAALVEHIGAGAKGGNVRVTAFLLIFGGVISLFFLILGASQPLFTQKTDDTNFRKVLWWNFIVETAGTIKDEDFGCTSMQQRLVGGGALVIISIFFTALSLILSLAQLVSASLRKAASITGLLSALTQLVAWGLAVTVFTGTFCEFEFYTRGYSVSVGLGLVIASFCLTTVTSVLNLLVAPE